MTNVKVIKKNISIMHSNTSVLLQTRRITNCEKITIVFKVITLL